MSYLKHLMKSLEERHSNQDLEVGEGVAEILEK